MEKAGMVTLVANTGGARNMKCRLLARKSIDGLLVRRSL